MINTVIFPQDFFKKNTLTAIKQKSILIFRKIKFQTFQN